MIIVVLEIKFILNCLFVFFVRVLGHTESVSVKTNQCQRMLALIDVEVVAYYRLR
jgi:hypothetical protein